MVRAFVLYEGAVDPDRYQRHIGIPFTVHLAEIE